jgi:hypothetical protein
MESGHAQSESWREILFPDGRIQMGWLTITLSASAVLVTVWSGFNFTSAFSQEFFITRFVVLDGVTGWKGGFP